MLTTQEHAFFAGTRLGEVEKVLVIVEPVVRNHRDGTVWQMEFFLLL